MKKLYVIIAAMLTCTTLAMADVCQDIQTSYSDQILRLQTDTNAALSQTSDPAEQEAIRLSYEMQLTQLQAEMGATLASAGCLGGTEPPPTDPGTTPTDPGTTPTDPGTTPTDPGTTPGPDETSGNCQEQLKTYAEELKTQGIEGRQLLTQVKDKAKELGCNFGLWNASTHEPSGIEGKHQSRPLGYMKENRGKNH